MTQSTRKLLAIFLILGSLIVHAILFGGIYANFFAWLPAWGVIIYFAIAGLLWMFPAGWIIRWMARPD